MTPSTALAACCLALAVLLTPQYAAADPVTLSVRVDNVARSGAAVRVAMFDEANWLSDEPVAALRTDARDASVTLDLVAPGPGRYGLAAYQDVNGDGRLKRNMVGMPTEPFAFSNDASANFGPPSFSAAAIDVDSGAQAVITLR